MRIMEIVNQFYITQNYLSREKDMQMPVLHTWNLHLCIDAQNHNIPQT